MNHSSREHLLGYLLGALDGPEQEEIEAQLARDPALQAELDRLRSCIGQFGMDERPPHFEPPMGLAVRTCLVVVQRARQPVRPASGWFGDWETARRTTWFDLVATAAILLIAVSLFFPALAYSRFQSQIASCQNNLRRLGLALHDFQSRQPDQTFPGPDAEGNRAFAGVYAPVLVGNQLVDESDVFLCPSSQAARRRAEFAVPTLDEIDRAAGQRLATLQHVAGGDYGYNLGFTRDGRLMRPRYGGRNSYVLLSDAPSNLQPGRASANHGGRGQNVLYEDGHVQFISELPSPQLMDDPFHNREGWIAAGVDENDAVLGASADRPIPTPLND